MATVKKRKTTKRTVSSRNKVSRQGGMLPLAAIAATVPIVIDIVKGIIDKKGDGTRIPKGKGTRIPRGSGKKS